jgi:hypothetical protein
VSLMPTNGSTIDPTLSVTPNGTAQSSCPYNECYGNHTLGPRVNSNNLTVPSLNIMPMGASDNCLADGFRLRVAATKNENGTAVDIEQKVASVNDLALLRAPGAVTAAEIDHMEHDLVRWRFELRRHPNNIIVRADLDNDGQMEYVRTLNGGVPAAWPEVYVNLLGVFYNMPGHPEVDGCYPVSDADQNARPIREIHWRNFQAGPMKHQSAGVAGRNIKVFPREANGSAPSNAARGAGLLRTDPRDTQRWDLNGVAGSPSQPNVTTGSATPDAYTVQQSIGVCTGAAASYVCTYNAASPSPADPSRTFTIDGVTATDGVILFLYDIGKPDGGYVEGTASITVNGGAPIALPNATSIAASLPGSLIRRYVAIPPGQLRLGSNQIVLTTSGAVRMDNMQIELLKN